MIEREKSKRIEKQLNVSKRKNSIHWFSSDVLSYPGVTAMVHCGRRIVQCKLLQASLYHWWSSPFPCIGQFARIHCIKEIGLLVPLQKSLWARIGNKLHKVRVAMVELGTYTDTTVSSV